MMKKTRILISGIVIWIVSMIFGWLTCGWLFRWVYAIPPNIFKKPELITNAWNMFAVTIAGLITAMLFATVYAILYRGIPKSGIKKGIIYGCILWLVGPLPGIMVMPAYMTISTAIVIYWIIQALVLNVINGAIVGYIYKEEASSYRLLNLLRKGNDILFLSYLVRRMRQNQNRL